MIVKYEKRVIEYEKLSSLRVGDTFYLKGQSAIPFVVVDNDNSAVSHEEREVVVFSLGGNIIRTELGASLVQPVKAFVTIEPEEERKRE